MSQPIESVISRVRFAKGSGVPGLSFKVSRSVVASALVAVIAGMAEAQPAQAPEAPANPAPALVQTPTTSYASRISSEDGERLKQALDSAKAGNIDSVRAILPQITDVIARKIALWALVDANADRLTFFELDQARRDLAGWARATKRQSAAERKLETSGLTDPQIVAWFGGGDPVTPEGVLTLAGALRATGKRDAANQIIRNAWRTRAFDADLQRTMLARFGDALTQDDHVRRAQILLYGAQGPAARDMVALLPPDQQALAKARMALRQGGSDALAVAAAVPPELSQDPGLRFERAVFDRRRGQDAEARAELAGPAPEPLSPEMASRVWDERYQLTLSALRSGDNQGAYNAAANSGLTFGADAAEAEFYAGWIALTRLHKPALAEGHFRALERIGSSPITRGRALYWRGRAVEALAGMDGAQPFYEAAARYNSTFYGQLASEKLGLTHLDIGKDPVIKSADRSRFEARETVRAARLLIESGYKDLFRTFVLSLDDVLPSAEEEALRVDLVRGYGDQEASMKVVRSASQRGFVLPERGYPLRTPPEGADAAEPALVLGITRQESSFDPRARSGAGARGMMQLMPGTAAVLARRAGIGYSADQLYDPDYNMRLGSTFLGGLVSSFSGSYVMAIAGYNAGPGRPTSWTAFCGDPRGGGTDPIDFIECIPFSETRNYVMRVMEGMQVYRARLGNGSGPLTLSSDLKRGTYVYTPPTQPTGAALPLGGANSPIPNPP